MLWWVGRGRWVHAERSEWSEGGDMERHGMQICLLVFPYVWVDVSVQGVATCPASVPILLMLKGCLEPVVVTRGWQQIAENIGI